MKNLLAPQDLQFAVTVNDAVEGAKTTSAAIDALPR